MIWKKTNSKIEINLGFGLIEVLVYLVLFAILMVGVLSSVYVLAQSGNTNQAQISLNEEGSFILSKIIWAFSGASGIAVPAAGQLPSAALAQYNLSISPLVFSLNSGKLQLAEGSNAQPSNLNSSQTQITNLNFIPINDSNGKAVGLTIDFTLNGKTLNGKNISQTFELTKYLRR